MREADGRRARLLRRRVTRRVVPVLSLALALAAPGSRPGVAQPSAPPTAEAAGDTGSEPGGWSSLLGRPAPGTRIIGGLWTLHPFAVSWPRVEETYGYGLLWRGFFGATFVNSYGDRAVTAGVEREWFRLRAGPVALGAGYRAGLVTGYDERLLSWADDVPALPLLGLQLFGTAGPLRVDAFYIYRVITLEASVESWWDER